MPIVKIPDPPEGGERPPSGFIGRVARLFIAVAVALPGAVSRRSGPRPHDPNELPDWLRRDIGLPPRPPPGRSWWDYR